MDRIPYIITSVPNVVWSAIIASCLTFLGVMLTNRGYAQRQRESLAHEERKFQFEQNMVLKKEVYLEMAAMFARALGIIPKLVNLEFSCKELGEYSTDPEEAAAKALLIADTDTVSILQEFTADLSEEILLLIKQREKLLDHRKAIDIYQEMIANANSEKDRLIAILKESNIQGEGDIYTLTYIENNYKSLEGTITTANNRIDEQKAALEPAYAEFVQKCWAEYTRLSVSMVPVIISVRNELDSGIDARKFEDIMQKSMSRVVSMMNKTVPEAEEEI